MELQKLFDAHAGISFEVEGQIYRYSGDINYRIIHVFQYLSQYEQQNYLVNRMASTVRTALNQFDSKILYFQCFKRVTLIQLNSTLLIALIPHSLMIAAFLLDELLFNNEFIPDQTNDDLPALLNSLIVPFFVTAATGNYLVANLLPTVAALPMLFLSLVALIGALVFQLLFLQQDINPSLTYAFVGAGASLFLLLATTAYYFVHRMRGSVGQTIVLSINYLLVKALTYYIKFGLLSQQIKVSNVVFPSQVLIFTLLSSANFFMAYRLIFDPVQTINEYAHSILTYVEPEGEEPPPVIKRWEYSKPEYIFPPSHAAFITLVIILLAYQVGLQFLLRNITQNSPVFYLILGMMLASPAWLALGLLYKYIYLSQFRQEGLQRLLYRMLPFITILPGPVVSTIFRASLYDPQTPLFFTIFFYGMPLAAVFWDFSCKYVIIDRYKFLLSCTAGIVFCILPLLIFLPIYLKDPQVVYLYVFLVLIGCLGAALIIHLIVQICIFAQEKLVLNSLKQFRRVVRDLLKGSSTWMHSLYLSISAIGIAVSVPILLYEYSIKDLQGVKSESFKGFLIATAAFSVLLYLLSELALFLDPCRNPGADDLTRKLVLLLVPVIGGIITSSLSLLISSLFVKTLVLQIGVGLVITGLLAAIVYQIRHAVSQASESFTRMILVTVWYLFLMMIIGSTVLYAHYDDLGVNQRTIFFGLVLANMLQILTLVTLLGVFVHIILNFSAEYRKFIILKDAIIDVLKPMQITPDDNAIVIVMQQMSENRSLQEYQKALLDANHLRVQENGDEFVLLAKRLQASQGIQLIGQEIVNQVVKMKEQEQAQQQLYLKFKIGESDQYVPLITQLRVFQPSTSQLQMLKVSLAYKAAIYNDTELKFFWGKVWLALTLDLNGRRVMHPLDFHKLMVQICNVHKVGPPLSERSRTQLQSLDPRISLRKYTELLYLIAMDKYNGSEMQSLSQFTKHAYPQVVYNLAERLNGQYKMLIQDPKDLEVQRDLLKQKRAQLINRKNQIIERHLHQHQAGKQTRHQQPAITERSREEEHKQVRIFSKKINAVKRKPPPIERVCNRIALACMTTSDALQNQRMVTVDTFDWSLANLLMVSTKIIDYVLIFAMPIQIAIKEVFGSLSAVDKYTTAFDFNKGLGLWLSCLVAGVYFVLVYVSIDDLRKNTLGIDQFGQVASLSHKKYWIALGLNFCSNTLIARALVYCLYATICIVQSGETVLVQQADPSTKCLQQLQAAQMVMAIVILLTYYPMAIVISPITLNIDRSLTIKYKTEFSVIFVQLKILLSLISQLNRNNALKDYVLVQSSASLAITALLLFFFWQMQPSLIVSFGRFEMQLILAALAINAAGFVFLVTPHWVGYVTAGALILLQAVGYYFYLKYSNRTVKVDDFDEHYRNKMARQKQAINRLTLKVPSEKSYDQDYQVIQETEEYLKRK